MPHSITGKPVDVTAVDAGIDVIDGEPVIDLLGLDEEIMFALTATINAGTTLDVDIEGSIDGANFWSCGVAFPTVSSDTTVFIRSRGAMMLPRYIRFARTSIGNGWSYKVEYSANSISR